ncbi:MAG: hypothetical protein EHM56_12270 [Chloroflexi bacterium]|nr:MAG: hypothetical protein EHM56_12270 [Chloroflexota bacterium]
MKVGYAALAGRVRQSLSDLDRVVTRARSLMDKAQTRGDYDYLDGVALNLHGFYAGVERILEDVARTMEKTVPDGPEWHQNLLLQLSAEIPAVRPAVLSQETRDCLEEYRGFRHVVRNVYTFNLRPSRLQELTSGLQDCYQAVTHDLEELVMLLEQLSAEDPD